MLSLLLRIAALSCKARVLQRYPTDALVVSGIMSKQARVYEICILL
jgi:hypothetical protein